MFQLTRYSTAFAEAVRSDLLIYIVVTLYLVAGLFVHYQNGTTPFTLLGTYAGTWGVNFGIIGPYFAGLLGALHILHRLRKRRALAFRHMFAPRRVARFLAGTLLLLTVLLLFTDMFSTIKSGLSAGGSFPHDLVQADIDKALHFGVDPYRLLYAVGEHQWLLRALEFNYNTLWFIICYFTLYWVVTSPRSERVRLRFVLTWFLSWIIVGNIVAGAFLSAGPAYYGFVTGDEARFADQLAFLATSADNLSSAHSYQAYLWSLHISGQGGFGSGISAFPSMHVALATLIALFAGEHSRRLGAIMWAYVALIVLSSVYLGWHYAIDGYASIVLVTSIYWALRLVQPRLARLAWRPAGAALPVPG